MNQNGLPINNFKYFDQINQKKKIVWDPPDKKNNMNKEQNTGKAVYCLKLQKIKRIMDAL